MQAVNETRNLATTVLARFGCSESEIAAALTSDALKELQHESLSEGRAKILSYLRQQIEAERAEKAAAPMVLKTVDFKCSICGHEERDCLVDVATDQKLSDLKMDCPKGRHVMHFFWPPGTRMAVFGEENVPKEQMMAAQTLLTRGPVGDTKPFAGTTRSELKAWERENHLAAAPGDEGRRGNSTINTKTRYTDTTEFQNTLMEHIRTAEEIVDAGGDRLAEAKAAIEAPNDYDVNKTKQQAESTDNVGAAYEKDRQADVSDFAEELSVSNG